MRNLKFPAIIVIAIIILQSCSSKPDGMKKAVDKADSASYMIGVSVGHSLKMQDVPNVNAKLLSQGIMDVLQSDSAISMQEANMYLSTYFANLREIKAKENLEKGRLFLEENKNNPGVIETASGLQYKVIQEGTGKSPTENDRVKCHYRGKFLSGEEFDNSYEKGMPAEFSIKGVIRGWTEGLQLMKEGGKYELYIPSDLAYGPRGGGQTIGPNEVLVFEIELLEVISVPETETNK